MTQNQSLPDFLMSPQGASLGVSLSRLAGLVADASEESASQQVVPLTDSTSEESLGSPASTSAGDAAEASLSDSRTTIEGPGNAEDKPEPAYRTLNTFTFADWATGSAENVSCYDGSVVDGHVVPTTPSDEAATATGGEPIMADSTSLPISREPTPGLEGTVRADDSEPDDAEEDSEAEAGGDDEARENEAGEGEAVEDEAGGYEAGGYEAGDNEVGATQAIGGDETNGDDNASDDQVTTATVFPVAIHKCGDHNHAHSHAKQRIVRVPDGLQLFSVGLKVHFNDTLIDYSRTMASMSSMTDNVDSTAGLDGHGFKHLYKLIDIRFIDLVAGIDPAERKMPRENRRLLNRYTVELDLSTGEDPKCEMDITAKLEEAIWDAIEVVDGLAAEREIARRDPQHCPCSIILDSEVRRAFEKGYQYERKIAMLKSNIHNLIAEIESAAAESAVTASSAASQAQHPQASNSPDPWF